MVREFITRYKYELKSNIYNPWIQQEMKPCNVPAKPIKSGAGRQAAYPDMEKQLHSEFKEFRAKRVKVKEWWIRNRCKSTMTEKYPKLLLKGLTIVLHGLNHHNISPRRPTNVA